MNLSGATWRKSTRSSGGGNNDCVEVARLDSAVGVRDSKDSDGPVLQFASDAWAGFVTGLRAGTPHS